MGELFIETPDGWHVYREDLSCVLYRDYESGTTIRISNREDEGMVYFSAVNEAWGHLADRAGSTYTLTLQFDGLKMAHGAAGVIFKNPDGRWGYSAGHIINSDFLRDLQQSNGLRLMIWSDWGGAEEIERFDTSGGTEAVLQLHACSSAE